MKNFTAILIFVALMLNVKCEEASKEVGGQNDSTSEMEMKEIVQQISDLAKKIIVLIDPIAKQTEETQGNNENTYFLSFMLKDRTPSNTIPSYKSGRKMTINNNFSGEKMLPSQYFYQQGQAEKQPPSHNIQLQNNQMPQMPSSAQNFQ